MIKCVKYKNIDKSVFINGKTYLIMWEESFGDHIVEDAMYSDSQPYSEGRVWWINNSVDDSDPSHVLCDSNGNPIIVNDLKVE